MFFYKQIVQQIILISFIILHNAFWISYACCIASVLPELILDYVHVLHSKINQLDPFSFYIGATHYFMIKILLTPIFLFLKTHDLFVTIGIVKSLLGFQEVPARALLADFSVCTYVAFKIYFFFKIYVELLNIQFAIFEKDKTDKDKELLCEFERDNNQYKYLFLKHQLRFHLFVLQVFFSLVYLVTTLLLLYFFNLQTSTVEYYIRVIVEFDTNPQYLLRYGHYYR